MTPRFFAVPYDSGYERERMGNGPARIARALGVEAEEILSERPFKTEATTAFELNHMLADRVRDAVAMGDFPVVFSGNCGGAIGTAAGIGCEDLAAIWFDAHGDYNTPDTTETGFLDGMSMAVLERALLKRHRLGHPPLQAARPFAHDARRSARLQPGERDALLGAAIRTAVTR